MSNPIGDATAHETETARSIVFVRMIDAPRAVVFSAFTTAEHLARWWGPAGFSTTTHAFDFRPGGVWRLTMHGPDGRAFRNRIVFDVIEPPSRILSHHAPQAGDELASHEMRITLEAVGLQTRLEWRNVFRSIAERDRIVREYGAEEGLTQTVTRLGAYLAQTAGR